MYEPAVSLVLEAPRWGFSLLRTFGSDQKELPKLLKMFTYTTHEEFVKGKEIYVCHSLMTQKELLLYAKCLKPGTSVTSNTFLNFME